MKIKGIIFDMDGTVIDSIDAIRLAIKNSFNKEQCAKIMEHFNVIKGMSNYGACNLIKTTLNLNDSVDEIEKFLMTEYQNNLKNGLKFIKGFPDFSKKLNENKIQSCIATNESQYVLDKIIPIMNLNKFFGDNIFSVDHVQGIAKPEPDLFLYSLEKLGCKKSECLVFEDSKFGIQAAKNAGIKSVGVSALGDSESLHDADFIINDYTDLNLNDLENLLN